MSQQITIEEKIEVLASGLRFPEGPAFSSDGALWAVELKGACIARFFNGELQRWNVEGAPNGIAIDENDLVWFCDAGRNEIRQLNATTGETKTMLSSVDGVPLAKPNDLAFDEMGNLLFTCPGESRKEPTGYACVLMVNGEVKKITGKKFFPNGIAFTDKGKSLVLAETYKHRLWKGDWNAGTATWTNEQVWCDIGGPDGPGGPDGIAFDEAGNIYVAVYGTGSIRIADTGGKKYGEIKLPGMNPTNCAFEPGEQPALIVTEAEKGELLRIILKKKGMPLFKGKSL